MVTPELADFADFIDFAPLQTAHETMQGLGLEPELVLAPVLGKEQWQDLFSDMQNDKRINHDGRIKSGGLYINDDIQKNWNSLQGGHMVSVDAGRQYWQLLVIPGTERPAVTDVDHNGVDPEHGVARVQEQAAAYIPQKQQHNQYLHPTIPAYLTLQATKLLNHEPPVDSSTWTWLDGSFENDSQAPLGDWYPVDGRVRLYWSDVGGRVDDLGVRLPVWGEALDL